MVILYYLAIKVYGSTILLLSFFNPKAKKWITGRLQWENKISKLLQANEKRILFHCASYGEFEQGKPVLEALKRNYPDHKFVLTFFSPSGYELRKNEPLADYVFYLPLDTPSNARKFTDLIKPRLVFFVKYDFWYFFIKEFHHKKIPVFFVSSVFRSSQVFFQSYGFFFRKMLLRVTHFFVQNQVSLELLYKKGITEVTVTGDTRFDRVFELSKNSKELPIIESFRGNKQLFIAGSTWLADESLLVQLVNHFDDQFNFVIAPHEITENNISALEKKLDGKTIRYSTFNNGIPKGNVLILDNVGMLASVYRYGRFVYVGGGFGKGIHNILEAAVYGNPVFFGPNFKKFTEAKDLLRWKGAFMVKNGNELVNYVQELLNDPKKLQRISEINMNYVKNNKGATDLIINYLKLNYSYS